MLKLTDRKWKLFLISEIFEVESTETNEIFRFEKGTVPFICASNFNNGIQGFINPHKDTKIYKRNSLTVSSLDGTTFFQEIDFVGRGHGSVQVLFNKNINKFSALFISTVIKKSCIPLNLSYSNQLFLNKLKSLKIKLPVDQNNNPDWKFMEDYINERERDCYQNLITIFLKKPNKLNISNWKTFKISDYFDVKAATSTSLSKLEKYKQTIYPYVTTQASNNGIADYFGIYTDEGNVLVVDSAVAGYMTYQDKNFSASDHVEKLIPKFKLNKFVGLFIASIWNKKYAFKFFNYGFKASKKIIKNMTLLLPTKNNEPDWDFMEKYIKSIYIY